MTPTQEWEDAFLEASRRSRKLHGRWVRAAETRDQFRAYAERARQPSQKPHLLVKRGSKQLVGVININEIVRGGFQSGYLGYYAFAPHQGLGYMTEGLALVVRKAFREYKLHRLEANIQPDNVASVHLVRGLGFRLEGRSPRYLKIAGQWRDHERWATLADEWKGGMPQASHRKGRTR